MPFRSALEQDPSPLSQAKGGLKPGKWSLLHPLGLNSCGKQTQSREKASFALHH